MSSARPPEVLRIRSVWACTGEGIVRYSSGAQIPEALSRNLERSLDRMAGKLVLAGSTRSAPRPLPPLPTRASLRERLFTQGVLGALAVLICVLAAVWLR